MSLKSEQIDVKGRSTEVLRAGDGEPLVFVHGAGIIEGFDCIEPLSESFSVYCPLLPGYGATELDPPVEGRPGLVTFLRDTLDALGLDRVVLVGFSLGGWLSSTFAATYPERVTRLVLGAPFGLADPEHPMANVSGMEPQEILSTLSADPKVWEGRLPTGPDADFAAAREREGQSLARIMPGPFDPDLPPVLSVIASPVLILWGAEDRLQPVEVLDVWTAALPQAETRVLAGTGHLLFHERPEAVAAIADLDRLPQ